MNDDIHVRFFHRLLVKLWRKSDNLRLTSDCVFKRMSLTRWCRAILSHEGDRVDATPLLVAFAGRHSGTECAMIDFGPLPLGNFGMPKGSISRSNAAALQSILPHFWQPAYRNSLRDSPGESC